MVVKICLDSEYCAHITCPKCMKSFTKNLPDFKSHSKEIRVKCNCSCGHSFPAILERRRHDRKQTHLTGAYIHDRKQRRGIINIKDISRSGMGFETTSEHLISSGDVLLVRFNLDDIEETLISKEVRTKRVIGNYTGNEFLDIIWGHDPLHSYLNNK